MHQKSSKIASWRPLGTSCGRLSGILGSLGGILGSPKRHVGDYCMLLNGLGRFQNALGTFQEAPERETMIFHWFWEVLGGAPCPGHLRAGIVRPPKSRFFKTDQTPLELGKCLGLGNGKGLGTDIHRHKGKGKDTGQVGRITHSRRRAKRGGGSIYLCVYIYIYIHI